MAKFGVGKLAYVNVVEGGLGDRLNDRPNHFGVGDGGGDCRRLAVATLEERLALMLRKQKQQEWDQWLSLLPSRMV